MVIKDWKDSDCLQDISEATHRPKAQLLLWLRRIQCLGLFNKFVSFLSVVEPTVTVFVFLVST